MNVLNFKLLSIIGLLWSLSASFCDAQEVRVKSIPYPMFFENTPSGYQVVDDDQIRFSAPPRTDLFNAPNGKSKVNKSPRLLFQPDSSFVLSAKIVSTFDANWDAGDLIIYNDESHWAKLCFERDFWGQPRVVSVVCNDVADDCNSMPVDSGFVYYQIAGSTKRNTFNLYYSSDGDTWFPIRMFRLEKIDNLRIGFSVQSPVGQGTTALFSEIRYGDIELSDRRNGK